MLDELRRLHGVIVQNLDIMDELLREPVPETGRLASTRYALTRASRARTVLLERAYPLLLERAPLPARTAIERLRLQGKNELARSASHIGSWTMQEIVDKWSDYRAASDALRTAMRQRVAAETECVYPVLAALGTVSSAA